jgi:hypothetical protein
MLKKPEPGAYPNIENRIILFENNTFCFEYEVNFNSIPKAWQVRGTQHFELSPLAEHCTPGFLVGGLCTKK